MAARFGIDLKKLWPESEEAGLYAGFDVKTSKRVRFASAGRPDGINRGCGGDGFVKTSSDEAEGKRRAARDRWSLKMRDLQSEARDQLSRRVVSREAVTALVKVARRTDTAD